MHTLAELVHCGVSLPWAARGTSYAPGCLRRRIAQSERLQRILSLLWAVALVTFVVWIVCFAVFHVAAGLMPLVLVIATVAAVYDLITDRRQVM